MPDCLNIIKPELLSELNPNKLLENTDCTTFGKLIDVTEGIIFKFVIIPFLEEAINLINQKKIIQSKDLIFKIPVNDNLEPDISRIKESIGDIKEFAINQLIYFASFVPTSKVMLKLKKRDKEGKGYDVSGWICPETFLEIQEISDCLESLENLSNQDTIKNAQDKFCAKPYYEFCIENPKEIKGKLEFIFYPILYLIDE